MHKKQILRDNTLYQVFSNLNKRDIKIAIESTQNVKFKAYSKKGNSIIEMYDENDKILLEIEHSLFSTFTGLEITEYEDEALYTLYNYILDVLEVL